MRHAFLNRDPRPRGGALFFVAYVAIATVTPLTVDAWLGRFQLFDLTGLGLVGGTIACIVALQLGVYWWHRALHRWSVLWRIHQLHHSSERVDIFSAFVFHPLDVVLFTLVGSLSAVLVIGVDPVAAGCANVITFLAATIGHTNIRTPHWLGYVVQRPENHSLHHERGVHAYNYADFSFVDMLFGTFRNPKTWEGSAGFYDGASSMLGAMLIGKDISTEKT